MVRKKITACIVNSLLIGTLLPGCALFNHTSAYTVSQGTKNRPQPPAPPPPEEFVPTNRKTQSAATRPARHRRAIGTFTMRAYTHYGNRRSRTATGTFPAPGRTIAVDPRVIPLGSVLEIDGLGRRIAEDTGGAIKGKKLDLFLPSVHACRQFGVQSRKIYLVD